MVDKHTWFYGFDSIAREKKIHYILNDSLYKNKLTHYNYYQLSENVWDASLIRTTSVALLWKIKNIRNTENPPHIEEFLKALKLTSLKEISCNAKPYKVDDLKNVLGFFDCRLLQVANTRRSQRPIRWREVGRVLQVAVPFLHVGNLSGVVNSFNLVDK